MLRFSWVRASAMVVFLGSLSVPRATFAQAVQPGPTQASQTTHEIRYADQIDAFIERDRVSPPPQGAILILWRQHLPFVDDPGGADGASSGVQSSFRRL